MVRIRVFCCYWHRSIGPILKITKINQVSSLNKRHLHNTHNFIQENIWTDTFFPDSCMALALDFEILQLRSWTQNTFIFEWTVKMCIRLHGRPFLTVLNWNCLSSIFKSSMLALTELHSPPSKTHKNLFDLWKKSWLILHFSPSTG